MANITGFTIDKHASGNYVCEVQTNIATVKGQRPIPQKLVLDAVQIKEILNLLDKAVVQAGADVDVDHIAKVNYLKV